MGITAGGRACKAHTGLVSSPCSLPTYVVHNSEQGHAHAPRDAAGQQRLGDAAPRQAARDTHWLLATLLAAIAAPAAARAACGHATAPPLRGTALRRAPRISRTPPLL